MINLRTYTRYSLKHSIASIEDIVKKAKEQGDSHVAVLDKGGLHSTIYLAKLAAKEGLEPMLGYEFREYLTLWPTTHKGLRNLNKIVTNESKARGTTHDFTDIVAVYHPSNSIIGSDYNNTLELIKMFGKDNLYVEVEEHLAQAVRDFHFKVASNDGLKVIPTSTVLYTERKDALAHDYFHNYIWKDEQHLPSDNFYAKTKEEMLKWANPEWIKNVEELAQRIKLEIKLGKLRLPEFDGAPSNMTNFDFLRNKCDTKLLDFNTANRLCKKFDIQVYKDRLDKEFKDVKDAKLESYFLIVDDFCEWAINQGIKKGRGRGSGAGSLICYLLGITNIDPLEYGLIWERFYNAGRAGALPDIDTDFEKERREEVIKYIAERWGQDSVFQIITFGSFGPAKAITVVLNIGQCGFEEQKEISKLVHHKAETIKDALEKSPELKEEAERRKALFAVAEKLEGAYESFGKHAGGVIIADEPFMNGGLPMTWHPEDERFISAFDLGAVEDYGLLKVDILGLNTLNIIKSCEEAIRAKYNKNFDINKIPLDDIDVYKNIFDTGKTKCVFQLESQLGQRYSKLLKPRSIAEISDLITVVRPGAMEPGQTQQYLDVRDGLKQPTYPHPKLEKILGDTYSSCIYQEQVMFICTDIAGLDLKAADTIRRAAGKKKPELMAKQKDMFLNGCKAQAVDSSVADTLWSWIVEFSGYGFNKSHAVAYAFTSYETAYLKYHYPLEFFEAQCNYVVGDLKRSEHDKIREFIYDAKEFGVEVLIPSIKQANARFKITNDAKKQITYGLTYIKGVGDAQMPIIEKCKDETTFHTFMTKALQEGMKKNVIEALICAGALDHYGLTRNSMRADYELVNSLTDKEYESVIKEVNGKSVVDAIKEMSDEALVDGRKAKKLTTPNKTRREKLRTIIETYKSKDKFESILHIAMYEREFLGCDISVNETDGVFSSITHNLLELKKLSATKLKVRTAVHIDSIRKTITKKGQNPGQEMAFITGSDGTAIYDGIVVFPKQYQKFKNLLTEGRIIFIDGETSNFGGLVVNNMGILK